MMEKADENTLMEPIKDEVSETDVDSMTSTRPSNRALRWPEDGDETGTYPDLASAQAAFFHHTGLCPDSVQSEGAKNLHPALLHPYLDEDGSRSLWPLHVGASPGGLEVQPFACLIDGIVDGLEGEGDELEIRKRAIYQLEGRLRKHVDGSGSVSFLEAVREEQRLMLESINGQAERQGAYSEAFRAFTAHIEPDDRLFAFAPAAAGELLAEIVRDRFDRRSAEFREEVDYLAGRLGDLLRIEEDDSGGAEQEERLKHAVGGSFSGEFDFSSLADLIEEAPDGPRMPEERRVRIWGILSDLNESVQTLYAEPFKVAGTAHETIERAEERKTAFARLVKAVHMARLETENRYRPERHDRVFDTYLSAIPDPEFLPLRPPVLLQEVVSETQSETRDFGRLLGLDYPVVVLLTIERLYDDEGRLEDAAGIALTAATGGRAFVGQCCLSDAETFAAAVTSAASAGSSALLSVFAGSEETHPALSPYLRSAVAGSTRAFPAFRFDPTAGSEWADRFTAEGNESPDEDWPEINLDTIRGGASDPVRHAATVVDFLACDARFERDLLPYAPGSDESKTHPVKDFLHLGEDERRSRVPVTLLADASGTLYRGVVTARLVRSAREALEKWRLIQEFSGTKSSIAERRIEEVRKGLEGSYEAALEEARSEFENKITESTESVARQVVQNIAGGLLGLTPLQEPTGLTPVSAPLDAAPPVPAEEAPEPVAPAETAEPEDEDDLSLSLDEAYIDSPLCTTCNECTDLNGVMFAYNENKQAYIKDARAGTYRELVTAAESCPVKIIHPGKPLNPDEPDLDEWIERAKPFR